jgi:hypothetical protein
VSEQPYFEASDLDGDSLEMERTADEKTRQAYGAYLTVLTSARGMYLTRSQAERLHSFLGKVLT